MHLSNGPSQDLQSQVQLGRGELQEGKEAAASGATCRSKALVILGMHRSGTSALTRVCNLLGARLGGNLMPPTPGNNEAGFWEQQEIADLHDRLLAEFGSRWDDYRAMPEGWQATPKADPYKTELLTILRRDFSDAGVWALKDPRMCRLVPFWLSIVADMGGEPCFLLVIRNPLEVVASLKERDGLHSSKSALLWLRHMLDAERGTRGYRRAFVNYDALVADWRQAMVAAFAALGLDCADQIRERGAEIDEFLSVRYRHHAFSVEDLAVDPIVAGWAREAYLILDKMCRTQSADSLRELDRLCAVLHDAGELFEPLLLAQQTEIAARGARVEKLSRELVSVPEDLATAVARQEELSQELSAAQSENALRQAQIEGLTRELATAHDELARREARLLDMRRELEVQQARLDESARELAVLRAESTVRITELSHALADVHRSWSWRLTQPGRGLLQWLNEKLAADSDRISVRMLLNEFHGCVDEPSGWEVPERIAVIRGWCFHNQGRLIRGIRARVGREIFRGQHGVARPDVAKAHPNHARADHSGFEIAVKVPCPGFRIAIEVRPDGLDWVTLWLIRGKRPKFSWKIIRTRVQRQWKRLGCDRAVRRRSPYYSFNVDDPLSWALPSRQLLIRGWCFHNGEEGIKDVRAMVNRREWKGCYGLARRDVAESFPNKTSASCSGFVITAEAPRGWFTVVIEVQNDRGEWVPLCEARGRAPLAKIFETPAPRPLTYKDWVARYDTLTKEDEHLIKRQLSRLPYQPLISVLMPAHNTPEPVLRRALESVCEQLYPHWELCIANDASTQPHVKRVLDEYARKDKRIKVVHREKNGHIAIASNSALELVAGEFVALLDHDDELRPHSLFMVAEELNRHPKTDLIYTDEDKIDENGNRFEPYFKTEWNPDLLRSANYVSHLGVYRTRIVKELRGFRHEFVGSQDYDLLLRFTDEISANRIRHIPHILYHWRAIASSGALTNDAKPYAHINARKALEEHLRRRHAAGTVQKAGVGQFHRIVYTLPEKLPLLTLIMLSGPKPQFLAMGLKSVLEQTDYGSLRLIILPNNVKNPESLKLLEEVRNDRRVQLIPYDEPYNFSRMNNVGVAAADTELIGFFNDDLEVINAGWLKELVSHVLRPEVGGVGPLLFFPDNTVQHAGVILGIGGVAGHGQKRLPRGKEGYFGRAGLIQNFSAITAGCMVMRRSVFQEVGGFDEKLAVAFNDVDLCLKIRDRGYLLAWTPYAKLYHHESATLGSHSSPARKAQFEFEVNYMKERWRDALLNDPFYNPNLSLRDENFALAFPPRTAKSWKHPTRQRRRAY